MIAYRHKALLLTLLHALLCAVFLGVLRVLFAMGHVGSMILLAFLRKRRHRQSRRHSECCHQSKELLHRLYNLQVKNNYCPRPSTTCSKARLQALPGVQLFLFWMIRYFWPYVRFCP